MQVSKSVFVFIFAIIFASNLHAAVPSVYESSNAPVSQQGSAYMAMLSFLSLLLNITDCIYTDDSKMAVDNRTLSIFTFYYGAKMLVTRFCGIV